MKLPQEIQTITLPKQVMSVADDAFIGCKYLTKIIITGEYTRYLDTDLVKNTPELEEIEFTNPNERHQPIFSIGHRRIKRAMANGNKEQYEYTIL